MGVLGCGIHPEVITGSCRNGFLEVAKYNFTDDIICRSIKTIFCFPKGVQFLSKKFPKGVMDMCAVCIAGTSVFLFLIFVVTVSGAIASDKN